MRTGISIADVSFGFGQHLVIENLCLTVPTGEMWALVGRSGVGKTTLLQVIAGLFEPSSGSVSITDRDVNGPGRIKGVVFQEESLLGWLTVKENVLFPRHRHIEKEEGKRVEELLAAMGLAGNENDLPFSLSTGMRKRVEFARALFADDRYLLADEAFSTLDALTRRELWKLWQSIRIKEPRTGILSTHDPEEAIRLCDVVVPLIPGPPAAVGDVLRIPSYLSSLDTDKSTEELFDLKEQVLSSLKAKNTQH